jgi:hypothetical protein
MEQTELSKTEQLRQEMLAAANEEFISVQERLKAARAEVITLADRLVCLEDLLEPKAKARRARATKDEMASLKCEVLSKMSPVVPYQLEDLCKLDDSVRAAPAARVRRVVAMLVEEGAVTRDYAGHYRVKEAF